MGEPQLSVVCAGCSSVTHVPLAQALGQHGWACPKCGATRTLPAAAGGMPPGALRTLAGQRRPAPVYGESFRPPPR